MINGRSVSYDDCAEHVVATSTDWVGHTTDTPYASLDHGRPSTPGSGRPSPASSRFKRWSSTG